jgi:hypothetical protein
MSWNTSLIEQSHSSKSLIMQSQIKFTTIMFEGKNEFIRQIIFRDILMLIW